MLITTEGENYIGLWADGQRTSNRGICYALEIPYTASRHPDVLLRNGLEQRMIRNSEEETYRVGRLQYFKFRESGTGDIPILDIKRNDAIDRQVEYLNGKGLIEPYRGLIVVATKNMVNRIEKLVVPLVLKTLPPYIYESEENFRADVAEMMKDLVAFHDKHGLLSWARPLPGHRDL